MRMVRVRQAAAALSILALSLALSLTTGCAGFFVYPGSANGSGSGTGTTGTGDYVYVANGLAETVTGFEVSSSGLTAVPGSPDALGFAPTALVVNPTNSILFVASNSGIYSYAIATNGSLSNLSSGITSGLLDVVSLAVSPDGQWLFALDGDVVGSEVTVQEFAINSSTGALSTVNSSNQSYTVSYPITVPASPVSNPQPSQIAVATVSSGEYLFVTLGTGGIMIIPFNTATGLQAPTGTSAAQFAIPPNNPIYLASDALAVNASSSVLYVVDSDSNSSSGTIAAYTIGSNGTQATLTTVGTNSTADFPVAAVLNSAGSNIYVANQAGTPVAISAFSTTASGSTLPSLGANSLGFTPTALAVDRSGDYLLAISQTGNPDLTMYSFTSAGLLSEAASNSTGYGTEPAGAVAIAVTH